MKKIITLTLALILAIAFAACSFDIGGGMSGGGFGDITVGGSSDSPGENTPTPGQMESQTQQQGAHIDHPVVGIWGSGINTYGDYHNVTTGAYSHTSGEIKAIEFKADGTFNCFKISVGGIGGDKVFIQGFHKGNYRIDSEMIYLTNVMYKVIVHYNNSIKPDEKDSHDYKSVVNHSLKFELGVWDFPAPYTEWVFHYNPDGPLTFEDNGYISDYVYLTGSLERIVE